MRDVRLANRHGFCTGEVRKMEPQLVPRKASANRVAQRQVLGVGSFFAVSDRGSVSPAGHPFRKRFRHGEKIDKYGGKGEVSLRHLQSPMRGLRRRPRNALD